MQRLLKIINRKLQSYGLISGDSSYKNSLRSEVAAPDLGNRHLMNGRLVPNRYVLMDHLPKNAIVAEVGVLYAKFSKQIIKHTNPKELHLFDIKKQWNSQLFEDNPGVQEHIGDSSTLLANFPDGYFDWIYIDASHTFDGVWKDIQVAKYKIKKDGYLVFNDYTAYDPLAKVPIGVMKAVNKLCIEDSWELLYLAFQAMGYNDVVLRKIQE